METFNTAIDIYAPKEKVWEVLLGSDTYRDWTNVFNPTSHYKGDWSEGSKMLFLGTDETRASEGGMVSRIAKNIPYQHISIQHLGIVENGIEDTTSEKAAAWAPAFENYTLTEVDGVTELLIEQDLDAEYVEQFTDMWQQALERIKELSEA